MQHSMSDHTVTIMGAQNVLLLVLLQLVAARCVSVCKNRGRNVTANKSKINIQMCIAQCLDLVGSKTKCDYSEHSGNVVGDKCDGNFYRTNNPQVKYMACQFDLPLSSVEHPNKRSENKDALKKIATMCNSLIVVASSYDTSNKKLSPIKISDAGLDLMDFARKLGMQLFLIIGAWDDSHMSGKEFSAVTVDEKSRAKFLREIITVIDKFELHGVYIQWFFPGCYQGSCSKRKDKDSIIAISTEIFAPLRERGLKILFVVTVDYNLFFYLGDYFSTIMPHVDFFVSDTAYQAGKGTGFLEYDNSLTVTQNQLNKIASQISNKEFLSKVLYRVRAMAKSYEFYDIRVQRYKGLINKNSAFKEDVTVAEYCHLVRDQNYTYVLDASNQNFAYQGLRVVMYENGKSLAAKAEYVRQKLGGFVVVNTENDDYKNECGCGDFPYLRTISEYLNGRECIYKPCF